MIKSKDDLRFYLSEDRKRNMKRNTLLYNICYYIFPNDNMMAYKYLKSLRKLEYAINCKRGKGVIGNLVYVYRRIINLYLGKKYNINILPNCLGYGFYIPHVVGGGIIINCKSIGNYCSANSGVVVGINHSSNSKPTIGNNVDMNIGCKIVGNITIGDNVTIGPNSVIYKDVPSNCVVLGVPGEIIKRKTNV